MLVRVCVLAALIAISGCGLPQHAEAQPNATQAQQRLTADSTLAALLADARTRPVMERHFPNLTSNPHFGMIQDWPLRRLATDPHAQGLTSEQLTRIEAELAAAQTH